MSFDESKLAEMLKNEAFPRSMKYDPKWMLENEMGPNSVWLAEWLCERMDLRPGMRVLDMGCGRAMSSVFLAREFGVQVWANDLWISATDNWQRVREAGLEDRIFPIHAEARTLPYAEGFFDAIISLDSYQYYGTDDLYLSYFVKFVKPGGQLGIVVPGLMQEFENGVPEHLTREWPNGQRFWVPGECFCFHTVDWWQRHWAQTELVDVELADVQPDGWKHWVQLEEAKNAFKMGWNHGDNDCELAGVREDAGRYLGFVRVVARRKG